MILLSARIATQAPARLIRLPVSLDERQGEIQLSLGRCLLAADDGLLEAHLQASDTEQMQRLRQVVVEHLQRMAGDEALDFAWYDDEASQHGAD